MAGIFRGQNFLLHPRVDPWFAAAIGVAAATIRVRREETLHRLGLPTKSIVYVVDDEHHKFDDTPEARSRLAMSSWYLGDSKAAQMLREDAAKNKPKAYTSDESIDSNTVLPPLLTQDPKTGKYVLNPTTENDERDLTPEEIERKDEEFKRRMKEVTPKLEELARIFVRRGVWYCVTCWHHYWAIPWFWSDWTWNREAWKTSTKKPDARDWK